MQLQCNIKVRQRRLRQVLEMNLENEPESDISAAQSADFTVRYPGDTSGHAGGKRRFAIRKGARDGSLAST